MPERWRVFPGSAVDLSRIDPASTHGVSGGQSGSADEAAKMADELRELQRRLFAEGRRSLLVVLQGMDTSGKDGTIKHVFSAMNPMGIRVVSFKAPTSVELTHDFLWRIHAAAPAAGEIGIFNRSHYEDVVTARVLGLVPNDVWEARYDLINDFEELLAHGGTKVVKFFLHISKEEQRRRLEARISEPHKRWKFDPKDLEQRARWAQFAGAFEAALETTSTDGAPWYVIPADHNWYRNWAISRVLVQTLRRMDLRYPDPPDLGSVRIR